jgi:hypothetical protein
MRAPCSKPAAARCASPVSRGCLPNALHRRSGSLHPSHPPGTSRRSLRINAAQAIIVWDWSVAGTGTDITTGSITGVTGSFTGDVPGTFSVTGLRFPSNFQWSGESTNQLLLECESPNFLDLAADGAQGRRIRIDALSTDGFIPAQRLQIGDSGLNDTCSDVRCQYSLTSASLTPQSAPEPIPGPLPVLGAGAAFGFSRRLRRRISASQATPPQA